MDIRKALQEPLEGLDGQNVQATFQTIATNLFNNFCIKCGEKRFYFAEVEFYYFNDGEKKKLDGNWNNVTYVSSGYTAGDIFYHLSGMDVCFDSELIKENTKKSGYGGGILVRSIWDGKNQESIIVGPLTCLNKMLNACKGGCMPNLEDVSEQRNCNPQKTYRYLGKNDFELIENEKKQKEKGKENIDGNLKLAFYDANIKEDEWNHARSSYYSYRLNPDFTKRK